MSRSKDEIRKERLRSLDRLAEIERERLLILSEEEQDVVSSDRPAVKPSVGAVIESVLRAAPDGLSIEDIVSRAQNRIETSSKNVPNLIRARMQGFRKTNKVRSNRHMKPARYYWMVEND